MDENLTGRINVPLAVEEAHALYRLAEMEHRQPREQARFIIWRELKRRGLLPPEETRQPVPASGEPSTEVRQS